jgi:hypothetical protein
MEDAWILYSASKLTKIYLVLSHHRPGHTLKVPGVLSLPEFLNIRHMTVVKLSALRTSRLYHPLPPPPGDIPGVYFS